MKVNNQVYLWPLSLPLLGEMKIFYLNSLNDMSGWPFGSISAENGFLIPFIPAVFKLSMKCFSCWQVFLEKWGWRTILGCWGLIGRKEVP